MRHFFISGMLTGAGVALCGLVILLKDLASRSDAHMRVWNLLRWLRLELPAPTNPWFVGPTLAYLNCPLWLAACTLGAFLAASFWLMRFAAK